ncbi:MAG: hypothetical protein QOD12_3220 [Verrucomicrobiota bacterium]
MSFLPESDRPYKQVSAWRLAGAVISIATCALAFVGCKRSMREVTGPIPQSGYLWQRDWTPAVAESMAEAQRRMDGVVVLGAEIVWAGNKPEAIRASINWETLRNATKPVTIALRIAPFAGPFAADDTAARFIAATTKSLLEETQKEGVKLNAFQIDFDCAQKNLGGYRQWLGVLRPLLHPVRLIVTTLPSWLDEPEFARLIQEVDGYVLQVHSVPTSDKSGPAVLCDTVLARKWVAKAAKLGAAFAVALPTYRCLAGYDGTGKLLGVAMDSVQPAWPRGTRVLEFATDADELARLVNDWQKRRPELLRELFWYRVPVADDERNWRWATLSAVMAGRAPLHKLEVTAAGDNPVDLSISNTGEADEQRDPVVTVSWSDGSAVIASDALAGWNVEVRNSRAIFKPETGLRLRLSPGAARSIGWLRYDRVPNFRAQVEELGAPQR